MSQITNKYNNGKIYMITDNAYTKKYYGSTIRLLCQRMAGHRNSYKKYSINKSEGLTTVFEIFNDFGVDNCKIELVEIFPCQSKSELEAREGYYIQQNICVNKYIPCRTQSQYKIDNAENVASKNKEYKIKNADLIKLKGTKYYLKNKERILLNVANYKRKLISENIKPLE